MERPFTAYRGDEPCVFVSYAHADAAVVFDELAIWHGQGFRIWYDEGITPAHNWPDELARAIDASALFVLFVSPNSASSRHCQRETSYAVANDRPVLAVHLERTELPRGMALEIGASQAILRYELSEAMYREKIRAALTAFLPAPQTSGPDTTPLVPHSIETSTPALVKAQVTPAKIRRRNIALLALSALILVMLINFISITVTDDASPGGPIADISKIAPEPERTYSDIEPMVDEGRFVQAFRIGRDLALTPVQAATFMLPGEFQTQPVGAAVSIRELENEPGPWLKIGTTPTGVVPLPYGRMEVRIEHDEFAPLQFALTNPSRTLGNRGASVRLNSPIIPLARPGEHPEMVYIPAGKFVPGLSGFAVGEMGITETGAYLIDRYEVTNREFQAFVDAGGYDDERYWRGVTFRDEAGPLDWNTARSRFVDSTGRTGPATWELGRYPVGEEDHPVAGVSWYEAIAYARFAGKSLPNVYHWARAAYSPYGGGPMGGGVTLPPAIAPNSNLEGTGTLPVGSLNSIGAYGTYDQAGNVREWATNTIGIKLDHFLVGGGWDDFKYMGALINGANPMDRHISNGLRLSVPIDEVDSGLELHYDFTARSEDDFVPVNDEIYGVLTQQFNHSQLPLDPRVTVAPVTLESTVWSQVSLRTGKGERFTLHIIAPVDQSTPVQGTSILFPGIGFFMSSDPFSSGIAGYFSFLTANNRVVVVPEFTGSYTRFDGQHRAFWLPDSGFEEWLLAWHNELARTIDYLETSPDRFGGQYFFYGISYGASAALPLIPLESRLSAAVVAMGGLTVYTPLEMADAVNYIPRIKIPVLYMAADLDPLYPVDRAQRPFLELLGTPQQHVRYVQYPGGHEFPSRKLLLTETANFLDKYTDTLESAPLD